MEMNENEWNVNNSICEQHGENRIELNHFMTILLLDSYFKINGWIYRSILGVLVKKIIKSNFIPSHSSQFRGEWKFKILGE